MFHSTVQFSLYTNFQTRALICNMRRGPWGASHRQQWNPEKLFFSFFIFLCQLLLKWGGRKRNSAFFLSTVSLKINEILTYSKQWNIFFFHEFWNIVGWKLLWSLYVHQCILMLTYFFHGFATFLCIFRIWVIHSSAK